MLGAGASFGARRGLSKLPPLGTDLAWYLRAWLDDNGPEKWRGNEMFDERHFFAPSGELWAPRVHDRLRAFLQSAVKDGFEKAAALLHDSDPSLLEPVNRLVAWSMLTGHQCAFLELRDRYDELFARAEFATNLGLISINYDILPEESLGRADRLYCYPGMRVPPAPAGAPLGVPIFKLHGSINCLRLFPTAVGSNYEVVRKISESLPRVIQSGPDQGSDTQREYVPPGDRRNLIYELKHNPYRSPVLAIYAPGKPVPYNHDCVEGIHRECLAAVARNPSARATIIGVRIPPAGDDERLDAVLHALRGLGGGAEYIARGDDERAAAKALGFKLGARTLEEYLAGRDLPFFLRKIFGCPSKS